jgi:hypothetical protein
MARSIACLVSYGTHDSFMRRRRNAGRGGARRFHTTAVSSIDLRSIMRRCRDEYFRIRASKKANDERSVSHRGRAEE